MKFSIYQASRKGARRSNQDRVGHSYTRDALLLVVADGMGGHLNGEVAAQIAVQYLSEAFRREAVPQLADPQAFLRKGMENAHLAIGDYARSRSLPESPRTTCVACVVQDNVAYWAHAGDSRLYHIRDGAIHARTRDHSRVQALIDQGRIREEAAAAHPERNKIWNCLGGTHLPQVELSRRTPLYAGDTILLCSDGLWGPLSPRIICSALIRHELTKALPVLMAEAELRAGRECDNLSAVAISWADNYAEPQAGGISTQLLDRNHVSENVEGLVKQDAEHTFLTDDEAERSIAEIRAAIRRQTPK